MFSLRHHLSTYLWVLKMGSDLCLKTVTVSVYEFMYILSVHALASYVQIGKIITISMVVLIMHCGQNYVSPSSTCITHFLSITYSCLSSKSCVAF